jgi:hypothetical protein
MAKVIGNGLTAVFGSDAVTIDVTSISMDAGERPQIDITAADEAQRSAVPGLRAVPTGSITGILNSDQIRALEGYFTGCDAVALAVSTNQADCSSSESLISADVHITGFTVDASIDEAATVTVNFMLAAGDTFVAPA